MTMEQVIKIIEAGKVKYPEMWKAMQFTQNAEQEFWALMSQDESLVEQVMSGPILQDLKLLRQLIDRSSEPILFFAE